MTDYSMILPFASETDQIITRLVWESHDSERTRGIPMVEFTQPIAQLAKDKNAFNDLIISPLPQLIVSERLKGFLNSLRDATYFQFIPLAFKGKKAPSYFILHCLDLVDAFDWDRSKYQLFVPDAKGDERTIRRLELMVIDEKRAGARKLFTMPDHTAYQFVEKKFGEQLIAEGFTGIRLLPLKGQTD